MKILTSFESKEGNSFKIYFVIYPVYTMFTFRVLKIVCKEMDTIA